MELPERFSVQACLFHSLVSTNWLVFTYYPLNVPIGLSFPNQGIFLMDKNRIRESLPLLSPCDGHAILEKGIHVDLFDIFWSAWIYALKPEVVVHSTKDIFILVWTKVLRSQKTPFSFSLPLIQVFHTLCIRKEKPQVTRLSQVMYWLKLIYQGT